MAWPGDRVQQMVIARLSLNNPYNNMTLLEGFFRKMTEIERERERDRKKEIQKERKKERKKERQKERRKDRKKKERKKERNKKTNKERKKEKKKKKEKKTKRQRDKERKRASELDAKWHGTGTAGNKARQVEFPLSVLPVGWMCTTVFAWLWSQVIAFGEALSPYSVSCTSQKTPAILKWSSTILTVTHMINFPLPCWTTNGCVTMLTEDSKNHTPHPGHLNLWILPLNRARQINIHCPRNGC